MLAALLLAAAVPQSLLDEGDARNQAYVTCLFAASREASGRGLTASEFESMLASRCRTEGAGLAEVMAETFVARGMSAATAEVRAREAVEDARASVVTTYGKYR